MAQRAQPTEERAPVDRRIARTKRALRTALFELIQEKGFDAVSVEEIARRADLSRTTFYLHFRDKEDLLLDEFIEMAQERVQAFSEIPLALWLTAGQTADPATGRQALMPLLGIFEHAAQNAGLYRALVHGASASRFEERIRAVISRSIEDVVQAKMRNDPVPIQPQVPLDLLGAYFSGALLSSLAWWLGQEAPPEPLEMARMFQRLFFPGARRVLGL